MDSASPGAYGWEQLDRVLERVPTADALELTLLCNRPLLDDAAPEAGVWEKIATALDRTQDCELEHFIGRHRADFDGQVPHSQIWNKLEQALPTAPLQIQRVNWGRQLMSIAAAISLLLIGLSIGLWYGGQNTVQSQGMAMSDVSHEYAELEQYYQGEITAKRNQLAQFTGSQSAEVNEDLVQLDHIMEELRRELVDVPPGNREQVVRAMIENYKAKTAILQRVLERLQQPNEQEDTSDQKPNKETRNI
jgi:DNA-directed RNA polymerase subunit F